MLQNKPASIKSSTIAKTLMAKAYGFIPIPIQRNRCRYSRYSIAASLDFIEKKNNFFTQKDTTITNNAYICLIFTQMMVLIALYKTIKFAIRNSQFAIRNSQFAIRNSQFPIIRHCISAHYRKYFIRFIIKHDYG